MIGAMEWLNWVLLFGAGATASFINVFAGGGSTLTLPALLLVGLSPAMANGTNKLALMFGTLMASWRFHKGGSYQLKKLWPLTLVVVAGSLIGTQISVQVSPELYRISLIIAMGFVLVMTLIRGRKDANKQGDEVSKPLKMVPLSLALFFAAMYGGFIQVGMGFLLMGAMAVATPWAMVQINGVKALLSVSIVAPSFVLLAFNGQVDWPAGLFMAGGNVLGAWIGSRFALTKGDGIARPVLIGASILMAARLMGIF